MFIARSDSGYQGLHDMQWTVLKPDELHQWKIEMIDFVIFC